MNSPIHQTTSNLPSPRTFYPFSFLYPPPPSPPLSLSLSSFSSHPLPTNTTHTLPLHTIHSLPLPLSLYPIPLSSFPSIPAFLYALSPRFFPYNHSLCTFNLVLLTPPLHSNLSLSQNPLAPLALFLSSLTHLASFLTQSTPLPISSFPVIKALLFSYHHFFNHLSPPSLCLSPLSVSISLSGYSFALFKNVNNLKIHYQTNFLILFKNVFKQ